MTISFTKPNNDSPTKLSHQLKTPKTKALPNITTSLSQGSKREGTDLKNPKVKKARTIIPYKKNAAPSLQEINQLEEAIQVHAEQRIQMFLIDAMAYYKKAVQTNASPLDVKVWVGPATLQDGQGDRANHAAHRNALAGLSDNLKECYEKRILEDGISPNKEKLLKAKNFSDETIQFLEENHTDQALVKSLLDKNWPTGSILRGTDLEFRRNATDYLPSSLNLGCDLTLEKAIRPFAAELIQKVMKGDLDPKQATDIYSSKICEHFNAKIENFKNQLDKLSKETQKVENIRKQLMFHENELDGSSNIDLTILENEFMSEEELSDVEPSISVDATFNLFI